MILFKLPQINPKKGGFKRPHYPAKHKHIYRRYDNKVHITRRLVD